MAEAPADELRNGSHNVKPEVAQDVDNPKANGHLNGKHQPTQSDPDAQEMVITSLRSQIQDLFGQVTDLNGKLVKSYDRVSDLEDDLHISSSNVRSSSLKIAQLELERTQHLSALNTGLLVEKSHVTSELNRLMEKATEEAAQRGQAESARADIEKDLDDLSATLFGQANSMVAEARFARHLSEQKVAEAERALKGAEEAVGMMQQQMQAMQAEKEEAEQKAEEARALMGKGKWVERRDSSSSITRPIRLLSSHVPYQEFLLFVAHLRSVHPTSPQPPAMTTLLPLPFLARLLNEDSEPTIRLDLAPSLNWLSRRSVLSAIHNGQLIIEPMSSSALLQESSSYPTNIPGLNSSSNNISCALCGTPVFSTPEANSRAQPPTLAQTNSNSISWSTALFKKPSHTTNYSVSSNGSSITTTHSLSGTSQQLYPPQIHIFRLASPSSSTPSIPIPSLPKATNLGLSSSSTSHPHDHSSPTSYATSQSPQSTTIYPLCANKWCLARLRTTCTLWAFVRTGVVERVWEEEVPTLLPPTIIPTSNGEKPPIPPRRRGLWGMASALGERATNWGEGDKAKKAAQTPPPDLKPIQERKLPPPPPPTHPTVVAAHAPVRHSVPPPLPKRSDVRRQPSPTTNEATPEAKEAPKPEATSPTSPQLPKRPPRRPLTPASVPLPDSRPHTPPTVHGSPLVAAITPAGVVPPPLPRRAAARIARPTAEGGSRPATPATPSEATGTTAELKPEGEKKETSTQDGGLPKVVFDETAASTGEAKVVDETVKSEVSGGEKLTLLAEAGVTDEKLPEATADTSTPEDVFVDAETTLDSEDAGKEAGQAKDKGLATEVVPPDVVESVPAPDGDETKDKTEVASDGKELDPRSEVDDKINLVDELEKDKIADTEENKGVELPDGKEGKLSDGKETTLVDEKTIKTDDEEKSESHSTEDKKTKSDDDGEAYIGDATWEERTWKEVVRLKEEMFWARIGGLKN